MKSFIFVMIFTIASPILTIGQNPTVGDPYIIVNKKNNKLAFIHAGKIQKIYPVATGRSNDLTPQGEFTITVKAKNPYYRRKKIPGGHPNNPLGSRWIGFNAKGTNGRIYGIHGNNNPSSIGKYISQGCIRMYEKDVQELYNKVPIGTKVLVVNTDKSFESLAILHNVIRR